MGAVAPAIAVCARVFREKKSKTVTFTIAMLRKTVCCSLSLARAEALSLKQGDRETNLPFAPKKFFGQTVFIFFFDLPSAAYVP